MFRLSGKSQAGCHGPEIGNHGKQGKYFLGRKLFGIGYRGIAVCRNGGYNCCRMGIL